MRKKKGLGIGTFFCICLFAIGILLMNRSTEIGIQLGQKAIMDNGGSLETKKYFYVMQESANDYRQTGSVVSTVGGVGIILFVLQCIKENEIS